MPKIALARRLPILEYIDSLGPGFDFDALTYDGVEREQAIHVLNRMLPVLKRAFPQDANLVGLFSNVWRAQEDPFLAEIGLTMFDGLRDQFWASFPETDDPQLYARNSSRPIVWTPDGWVRVVNDNRPSRN